MNWTRNTQDLYVENWSRWWQRERLCSWRMGASAEGPHPASYKEPTLPYRHQGSRSFCPPLSWIPSSLNIIIYHSVTFIYGLGSLWLFYEYVSSQLNDKINKSKDYLYLQLFHLMMFAGMNKAGREGRRLPTTSSCISSQSNHSATHCSLVGGMWLAGLVLRSVIFCEHQ